MSPALHFRLPIDETPGPGEEAHSWPCYSINETGQERRISFLASHFPFLMGHVRLRISLLKRVPRLWFRQTFSGMWSLTMCL